MRLKVLTALSGFVDDRATLDGASKDELRVRFKRSAAEAIVTEILRAGQNRNLAFRDIDTPYRSMDRLYGA